MDELSVRGQLGGPGAVLLSGGWVVQGAAAGRCLMLLASDLADACGRQLDAGGHRAELLFEGLDDAVGALDLLAELHVAEDEEGWRFFNAERLAERGVRGNGHVCEEEVVGLGALGDDGLQGLEELEREAAFLPQDAEVLFGLGEGLEVLSERDGAVVDPGKVGVEVFQAHGGGGGGNGGRWGLGGGLPGCVSARLLLHVPVAVCTFAATDCIATSASSATRAALPRGERREELHDRVGGVRTGEGLDGLEAWGRVDCETGPLASVLEDGFGALAVGFGLRHDLLHGEGPVGRVVANVDVDDQRLDVSDRRFQLLCDPGALCVPFRVPVDHDGRARLDRVEHVLRLGPAVGDPHHLSGIERNRVGGRDDGIRRLIVVAVVKVVAIVVSVVMVRACAVVVGMIMVMTKHMTVKVILTTRTIVIAEQVLEGGPHGKRIHAPFLHFLPPRLQRTRHLLVGHQARLESRLDPLPVHVDPDEHELLPPVPVRLHKVLHDIVPRVRLRRPRLFGQRGVPRPADREPQDRAGLRPLPAQVGSRPQPHKSLGPQHVPVRSLQLVEFFQPTRAQGLRQGARRGLRFRLSISASVAAGVVAPANDRLLHRLDAVQRPLQPRQRPIHRIDRAPKHIITHTELPEPPQRVRGPRSSLPRAHHPIPGLSDCLPPPRIRNRIAPIRLLERKIPIHKRVQPRRMERPPRPEHERPDAVLFRLRRVRRRLLQRLQPPRAPRRLFKTKPPRRNHLAQVDPRVVRPDHLGRRVERPEQRLERVCLLRRDQIHLVQEDHVTELDLIQQQVGHVPIVLLVRRIPPVPQRLDALRV